MFGVDRLIVGTSGRRAACRHLRYAEGLAARTMRADSVIAWNCRRLTAATGPGRRPHWKGVPGTGRASGAGPLLAVWG